MSTYKVHGDITSLPHVHVICKQVEKERSRFGPALLTLFKCGQWQRQVALVMYTRNQRVIVQNCSTQKGYCLIVVRKKYECTFLQMAAGVRNDEFSLAHSSFQE